MNVLEDQGWSRSIQGPSCSLVLLSVFSAVLVGFSSSSFGSDHADPLLNRKQEGGITDLFGFVGEGSQSLTLIVCVRRSLTSEGPIPLLPYTYTFNIDLNSEVSYDDREGTLARYGGRVVNPRNISPEISIAVNLHDSPETIPSDSSSGLEPSYLSKTLVRKVVTSGIEAEQFRIWAGVRDDPFILHSFSNTNCVAIVVEIPLKQFAPSQTDFLIWATSARRGKQIDHVGRSLRTMLPRLGFLNTLPPSKHVDAIRQRDERPGPIADLSAFAIPPLFGLRSYDFEPDVMILSLREERLSAERPFPNTYPNGRYLTDDVARICCEQGDCLLFEVSLADAHHDGLARPTANNKDFLPTFPYLADPILAPVAPEGPRLRGQTIALLVFLGVVLAVVQLALLYFTYRYFRLRRELREEFAS